MSLYEVLDGFGVPRIGVSGKVVGKKKYAVLDDMSVDIIFPNVDHVAFSGKDIVGNFFGVNVPRNLDNEGDYNELLKKMVLNGFSVELSYLIVISEDKKVVERSPIYHNLADNVTSPENVYFLIDSSVRYHPVRVTPSMEVEILRKKGTF